MRKIIITPRTWTIITVVVVVVFFGGYILATGQSIGDIWNAMMKKFSRLLGGTID